MTDTNSTAVDAQRARNMQLFNQDLDALMDQINGMLAHYQIGEWEAYVFFRKRDCPDSYVLKYEAAAGDEFAQKIVNLHRQPDTPPACIATTPPTTPSTAAMRAAEEIVPDCLSRTCFIRDCERNNCWGCDDSKKERERVAAIITRHLGAAGGFAQGVSAMREQAMQIAESYCEDIPQHVDVTLDRNSFAAGYLCAAGGIRQALSRTIIAATTSPSSETPQLTELQLAYNQGIEDAKCAIRATLTGGEGDRFKPYFITQIARTCSPFRYVAGKFTAPTYDQTVQAITDIQEARESHVQWAAHLRDADREDCKGCDGHAAHIGDATYHDEWVAKYDNVIYVLARAPFATTSPETPVGDEPLEFRTTKEAMEYVQRNNIPIVVPIAGTDDNEGDKS